MAPLCWPKAIVKCRCCRSIACPLTHGGRIGFQVENTLAAVGAAWSLGLTARSHSRRIGIVRAPIWITSPGRFNLLEVNGAAVVVDYGHNMSSLVAMIDALEAFPHQHRIAVYTAAGDRRDVRHDSPGRTAGRGVRSGHSVRRSLRSRPQAGRNHAPIPRRPGTAAARRARRRNFRRGQSHRSGAEHACSRAIWCCCRPTRSTKPSIMFAAIWPKTTRRGK